MPAPVVGYSKVRMQSLASYDKQTKTEFKVKMTDTHVFLKYNYLDIISLYETRILR